MEKHHKIYIAGHKGMVGSAIQRKLEQEGYHNIITKTSKELDLCNQAAVNHFFDQERPDIVFVVAAKVGGIHANNTYRAEFIYDNAMIAANTIHASYLHRVKKLLFLGSTCIYPKMCPQPIREEYLLTGLLEPTNEPYAIAKILGLKLCESYRKQYGCNFIAAMPTNLYGSNDNFDLENAHVLPALMRKFYEAKIHQLSEVIVWGSGTPRREFLFVDDLADACYFLMHHYDSEQIINIGYGEDITIKKLATEIQRVVGYVGGIIFDTSKPDGTPRKLTDSSKINRLGWYPKTSLTEGIQKTFEWYLSSCHNIRN